MVILPGIGNQTNTPDAVSQPMETQHNAPHILSPLAKYLLALNIPAPERRPLSTVKAPLVVS